MTPALAASHLIWRLVSLLDDGVALDIEHVKQRVDDGSLFAWLADTLNVRVGDEAAPVLLEEFRSLHNTVDARRKFGVDRNGLVLLLAWCIELYQQGLPRP